MFQKIVLTQFQIYQRGLEYKSQKTEIGILNWLQERSIQFLAMQWFFADHTKKSSF